MPKKNWALIMCVPVIGAIPAKCPSGCHWSVHEYGSKGKLQRLVATHPYYETKFKAQIIRRETVDPVLRLLNG